ncbi:unnamed protein product [Lampetra fluviatilis]
MASAHLQLRSSGELSPRISSRLLLQLSPPAAALTSSCNSRLLLQLSPPAAALASCCSSRLLLHLSPPAATLASCCTSRLLLHLSPPAADLASCCTSGAPEWPPTKAPPERGSHRAAGIASERATRLTMEPSSSHRQQCNVSSHFGGEGEWGGLRGRVNTSSSSSSSSLPPSPAGDDDTEHVTHRLSSPKWKLDLS